MNDLYLIGNGFDLAHGLKTSYNDFLLWYLRDSIEKTAPNHYFKDDLIEIDGNAFWVMGGDYSSIRNILQNFSNSNLQIQYTHDFFKIIVDNYHDFKWVDIEYEYYMTLVRLYKVIELNPQSSDFVLKKLKGLNSCFDAIKKKLVEYLQSIKIGYNFKNKQLEEILFERAGILNIGTIDRIEGVFQKSNEVSKDKKLFVCFNYTRTMELYLKHSFFENNLIYIHGELVGIANPIIFGYGDEMDPHYEKIENLNMKEFLDNMKSFGYFRTDNYQRVIRFVNSEKFTVKILGHSCGLSDRILLNTIFENENCEKIKIYHYERSLSDNDYFEKTQEISRHFKSSRKGDMRMKIVPFDKNSKMPQVKKDN